MSKVKILFVCLGNICRSPTTEAVFRKRVSECELNLDVEIDSAGTSGYHQDEPPDSRAILAASHKNYDLTKIRSRKINDSDFEYFDWILAMDESNRRDLLKDCPDIYKEKIFLFLDFLDDEKIKSVPDPYYGGAEGFNQVIDLVERASDGFIHKKLKREL